jgi:hypothetical protein
MLAAYITLDLNRAVRPNVEQVHFQMESLNQWHRTLPPPMQLNQLSIANPFQVTGYTKRSVLQLHILFLGLFTEPYRTCLVDIGKSRLDDPSSALQHINSMKTIEERCISAAQQSARVVSLLQIDDLVRSHCWVSV